MRSQTQDKLSVSTFLREVNARLWHEYHTPDLGNVEDVFGELIYSLLSTRTAPLNYQTAFSALQASFPVWPQLAEANEGELEVLLRPCGLHRRKARAIVRISEEIFVTRGLTDLEHLHGMKTEDAEAYLTSLPGVGVKVAKCVCLYALNRPVFPLDTHNLRILQRLGVVQEYATAREWASRVESFVPANIRFDLHVNLVAHGRKTCTARPACHACMLSDVCPYPHKMGLGRAP